MRNPDFLLKNVEFLLRNPDFLLKNVFLMIKQVGQERSAAVHAFSRMAPDDFAGSLAGRGTGDYRSSVPQVKGRRGNR